MERNIRGAILDAEIRKPGKVGRPVGWRKPGGAKPVAQLNREYTERHRQRGERRVPVWLPDDEDVVRRFREMARREREAAQERRKKRRNAKGTET